MTTRTLLLALAFAARIASAAVFTPETPLATPELRRAPGAQSLPAIATSGKDFFVAWEDFRFGGADVVGSRLDADGRPLDVTGIPLRPTGNDDRSQGAPIGAAVELARGRFLMDPDATWNGTDYVVTAWDNLGVTVWQGTDETTFGASTATMGVVAGRALVYSNVVNVVADLPYAKVRRAVVRYFAGPRLRTAPH